MLLQTSVSSAAQSVSHESIGVLCRLAYYAITYGKAQRAIDYLQAAAMLQPNNEAVLRLQAVAYLDAQTPMHTIDALRQLDVLWSDNQSAQDRTVQYLLYSLAYYALNQRDEAQQYFNMYLKYRSTLQNAEIVS